MIKDPIHLSAESPSTHTVAEAAKRLFLTERLVQQWVEQNVADCREPVSYLLSDGQLSELVTKFHLVVGSTIELDLPPECPAQTS